MDVSPIFHVQQLASKSELQISEFLQLMTYYWSKTKPNSGVWQLGDQHISVLETNSSHLDNWSVQSICRPELEQSPTVESKITSQNVTELLVTEAKTNSSTSNVQTQNRFQQLNDELDELNSEIDRCWLIEQPGTGSFNVICYFSDLDSAIEQIHQHVSLDSFRGFLFQPYYSKLFRIQHGLINEIPEINVSFAELWEKYIRVTVMSRV